MGVELRIVDLVNVEPILVGLKAVDTILCITYQPSERSEEG